MREHRPAGAWRDGGDIVPGERMGNFVLGKYGHELLPEGSPASLGEYALRYNVRVELEAGRVTELSTSSERFETAEGLKVGVDFADVEAKWGAADDRLEVQGEGMLDFIARYSRRGADFAVRGGKVVHLGVFSADPE